MKNILILFMLIITSLPLGKGWGWVASAQTKKLDSLLTLIKTDKEDTNKVKHLYKIGWEYTMINECNKGLPYCQQALFLAQNLNFKKGIAASYNNIALLYEKQGNYPEALKVHFNALKIREEIKDKKGIASSYNNIGIIYDDEGNYPEALKVHFNALRIREELKDKNGIAASYNNIGEIYMKQGNYSEALKMHFASLKIYEAMSDKYGIANSYMNVGSIHILQGNYPEALKMDLASLKLSKEIGVPFVTASCFINLGILYIKLNKIKEAETYLNKALQLTMEIRSKEALKETYANLCILDSIVGNYKAAFAHHKLYIIYRDSLNNEETKKKSMQSAMQYEFDKKETELKAKAEAQKIITSEEKKRQQFVIYAVVGVLLLVFVFSLFLYRRVKITQKQKHIIELQKHVVEEHQKEIIDSINYAKRIQYSLLASDELLKKYIPDSFVLFNPKDIVSGDFYWATEYKNCFYLAVCDSTGHGVPGAFMSILNMGFLSEAIKEKDITKPNEILNHVRSRLIETISKEGQKDGMDCILIKLEIKDAGLKIEYAAANNEPILLRDGIITELAKDRMPVGKGEKTEDFTLHSIELQKGDSLILYTDGYADQFGGTKGKKFKYKPLNEMLLANQHKPCSEQKDLLNKTFEDWKGNLEQVDDVTIVGIRV